MVDHVPNPGKYPGYCCVAVIPSVQIVLISRLIKIKYVYVGDVINFQEDLSRFSWYKVWMTREEAENKVRAYKNVSFSLKYTVYVMLVKRNNNNNNNNNSFISIAP